MKWKKETEEREPIKSNNAEKMSSTRFKQIETEIERKKKDDEKIELMTQFMLDPTSSATKLLEKRREMYELQEALQKDKEKFGEKEIQFKKTEEELRNRDDDFHRKIVDYYRSTFEKKQTDAHNHAMKIEQETKTKIDMENEISKLTTKNEKLRSDLIKLKKIHDSLKKYEEFLKNVKESHPENFNDVNAVMEKYKILEEKYKEIKEETEKAKKKRDEENHLFKMKKNAYETSINSLIASIQSIQTELKSQKEEKKKLEAEVTLMEQNSNSVVSSLEMILLAIDNIYSKCAQKSHWTVHGDPKEFEKYDKNDPEKRRMYQKRVEEAKKKIKYINNYLKDYQAITEEYKGTSKLASNKP